MYRTKEVQVPFWVLESISQYAEWYWWNVAGADNEQTLELDKIITGALGSEGQPYMAVPLSDLQHSDSVKEMIWDFRDFALEIHPGVVAVGTAGKLRGSAWGEVPAALLAFAPDAPYTLILSWRDNHVPPELPKLL